ncbi:MAG TPA: inorganic diphosphatase [Roseiflexaceae bacterium]
MMNLWRDLEPDPSFPDLLFVVVEVPQGGRNKYKFHRPTGAIKLDRVLATAARYPGDYGLVPQTLDTDGDPVNVLVMTNLPTFPGCIIEARPLALFRMLDGGVHDDKVLAVLAHDPFFAGYRNYTDLPPHYLKEVEHFFTVYKDLDRSRVEPIGWEDNQAALMHLKAGNLAFWERRKAGTI